MLISERSRFSSATGTSTRSPRTSAETTPSCVRSGTSPLPATSPPRRRTSASYADAAFTNLRKHRSDPCTSVAKKMRRARVVLFFLRNGTVRPLRSLRRQFAHGEVDVDRRRPPDAARDQVDDGPGRQHEHQGRDALKAELPEHARVR